MRIVPLEDCSGKIFYINVEHIISIKEYYDGRTAMLVMNEIYFTKLTPQEVYKKILGHQYGS
jgi:hypothetical protein